MAPEDESKRSRYERTSAELPSPGNDANEALDVVAGLRESLRDA